MSDGVCCACKRRGPVDAAHIKSRGAGGPNEGFNLIFLDRICHQNQHRWGWKKFLEKFPQLKKDLTERGWEIEIVLGRFRMLHPRLK
jgi:hypothetical protein